MNMKIIFKNGYEQEVLYAVAEVIRENIIRGCGDFQCFSDEHTGEVFLIVNLKEVCCITEN